MAAFNSTNRTGSRYSCSNVGRESKPKTATSTSEENPCNSHKTSWSKRLEIYLLTGIILVVSFLFVTPTILYALPPLSGTQAVSYLIIIFRTLVCYSHVTKTNGAPSFKQLQALGALISQCNLHVT